MSDTPLTNANARRGFEALSITTDEEEWVPANFARQLELERAKFKESLESISRNTCCDKCREAALVAKAALE